MEFLLVYLNVFFQFGLFNFSPSMFLSKVKAREGELPAFTFLSLSVCVKSTILTTNLDIVHLSFGICMEICLVFLVHVKPLLFLQ